jgi:hypothetical protein
MSLKDFERPQRIVKPIREEPCYFFQSGRRADELKEEVWVQNTKFILKPQTYLHNLPCPHVPELAFTTMKVVFPLCGLVLENVPDLADKPLKWPPCQFLARLVSALTHSSCQLHRMGIVQPEVSVGKCF